MNENQIEEIKSIFCKWAPLEQVGKHVADLENYNTEAIDFLFFVSKKKSPKYLERFAVDLIEEAFVIRVDRLSIGDLGKQLYEVIQKY